MLALAELIRTAGNVLLTPVELSQLPGARSWRRALVAAAKEQPGAARAAEGLRAIAPGVEIEPVRAGGRWVGLWAIRRRPPDVACLVLTGEAGFREKLLGALSGAHTVVALGASGNWYLLQAPAFLPTDLRWWPRAVLAALLCALYLVLVETVLLADAVWRLLPLPPQLPDPGPAEGRTVTFIVPTHNQSHLIDFCLPPLLSEAGREHRVLVVDDGSTDATAEHVRQAYRRVTVLRLDTNQGFARAVRAGVAATDTPLFALINTDVEVRPGFLDRMLPHFDREDVFAVCAQIELADGSQVETGNVAPAFSGILEPHHVPPTRSGPILYAGGASSVFHRSRYQALGGLDTIYHPFYWEDIDLGYRAWRRGWRSVFEPAASVLHLRRATIGWHYGDAFASETFLRNALIFVWKNLWDRAMVTQHLVYVWARLTREVLAGEAALCRAVLRALPSFPSALRGRWQCRRRGDLGDRDILAMADPGGGAAE